MQDEKKTTEVDWDEVLPLGPIPELMAWKSKPFAEKIEKLSFGNDEILTSEDEEVLSGLPPIEFSWGKTLLPPERKE